MPERWRGQAFFQLGCAITLLHLAAKAVYFKQRCPAKKYLTTDVTHTPTRTNTRIHTLAPS